MSTIAANLNELMPAPAEAPTNSGTIALLAAPAVPLTPDRTPTCNVMAVRTARPVLDLQVGSFNPADELLKNRFLCRRGSLLIAGNTGIGKSSLVMQMMMLWALGRSCFGIEPARPLKSLLIQGENDEADLAEMRDGVLRGLDLTEAERLQLNRNLQICDENEMVAEEFVEEVVEPLIVTHRPDLVFLDPLFQYLGGDSQQQVDASHFLRQCLAPVIKRHRCAVVIVHHTTKPGKNPPRNANPTLAAYDGFGSVEFANWPRAVLSLQSTNRIGCHRLVAGKRGGRLGWTMADGTTRCYQKELLHSREAGTICWQESGGCAPIPVPVHAAVVANNGGVREAILANVPASGIDKQTLVEQVPKNSGHGQNKVREEVKTMLADGSLRSCKYPRPGKKDGDLIQRVEPAG